MASSRENINFSIVGLPKDLPPGNYKLQAIHTAGRPAFQFMGEVKEADLERTCEHFTEASRVCLELLGELIPKVSPVEQTAIHARLGVIEDILEGAITRYTD